MSAPPFFVLASIASPASTSTTLIHPIVRYQYADDDLPPLTGLAAQNTLIMDFDPANPSGSIVHSLTPSLAVTGLRVTDAPGAPSDQKMYVIDTVTTDEKLRRPSNEPPREGQSAAVMLARFKQRNALLRSALDYASDTPSSPLPLPDSAPHVESQTQASTEPLLSPNQVS